MLKIKKPTVTDLKNVFYKLICGLHVVEKIIFGQRLKNMEQYIKTTRQLYKVQHACNGNIIRRRGRKELKRYLKTGNFLN